MQTFLPLPCFQQSVQCLDWRRLGKQRVEAYQIRNVLTNNDPKAAWRNHPAVQMWCGYENALGQYLDCCIVEWVRRGYNNKMELTNLTGPLPLWFGDNYIHESHRSNLLRKDETYYRQFGWTEPTNLPYVWPV